MVGQKVKIFEVINLNKERNFICKNCGENIKIWYGPKDLESDVEEDCFFCPVCNSPRLSPQ